MSSEMTKVKLDISDLSEELYYGILAELYGQMHLKFGRAVRVVDWEISADVEEIHEEGCPAIDGFGCRCGEMK